MNRSDDAAVHTIARMIREGGRRRLFCVRHHPKIQAEPYARALGELLPDVKTAIVDLGGELLERLKRTGDFNLLARLPSRTNDLLQRETVSVLAEAVEKYDAVVLFGLALLLKYPFELTAVLHRFSSRAATVVFVPHSPEDDVNIPLIWDHFTVFDLAPEE